MESSGDQSDIYFRDDKQEIRGPYKESGLQEWYRKKMFKPTFAFRFGTVGEFIPLEVLCELYGSACPFAITNETDEWENKDRQLKKLEKEVGQLKKQVGTIKEWNERLAAIEKKNNIPPWEATGKSKTAESTKQKAVANEIPPWEADPKSKTSEAAKENAPAAAVTAAKEEPKKKKLSKNQRDALKKKEAQSGH